MCSQEKKKHPKVETTQGDLLFICKVLFLRQLWMAMGFKSNSVKVPQPGRERTKDKATPGLPKPQCFLLAAPVMLTKSRETPRDAQFQPGTHLMVLVKRMGWGKEQLPGFGPTFAQQND